MHKRITLILSLITMVFASCCKEACLDEGLLVSFQKFTLAQTDTVLYVRYKPGVTAPLDSSWKYAQYAPSVPDTTHVPHGEQLEAGYDWQIYIPAVDRRYYVTNFQTGEDKCNCESSRYTVVRGYTVNGTEKQGNYLVLE